MDLYLQTAFDSFSVTEGLFVITKGDRSHRFNPQQVSRIWLNHKIAVEGEVIQIALKNSIEIIFLSREGFPLGSVSPFYKHRGISLQEKQWRLSLSPSAATYVSIYIFKGQIRRWQFLQKYLAATNEEDMAILQTLIESSQDQLVAEDLPFPNDLQEPYFTKTYYRVLNQILPTHFKFEKRSRRPAQDAFNALLNYALGWLYVIVQNAIKKAKLDPYIGMHHRPRDGAPALVFDLIEAYRPWIENTCVEAILQQTISLEDFDKSTTAKGGIQIKKAARKRIIQIIHQTFHAKTETETKLGNIYQDARELATFIQNYDQL